jgi:hypothetical protein
MAGTSVQVREMGTEVVDCRTRTGNGGGQDHVVIAGKGEDATRADYISAALGAS